MRFDSVTAKKMAVKKTIRSVFLALLGLGCTIGIVAFCILMPSGLLLLLEVIFILAAILATIFACGGFGYWIHSTYRGHLLKLTNQAPTPNCWTPNEGDMPSAAKVNVVHRNGFVGWRVDPKEKDWSLTAENPIKEYMHCNDSLTVRINV